jgi:hypothetical protein
MITDTLISNGIEQPNITYLNEQRLWELDDAPDGMATGSLPIIPSCQEAQATARSHPCVAEADEDHEFRRMADREAVREEVSCGDDCEADYRVFAINMRVRQAY